MTKQELRTRYLEKRKMLSDGEYLQLNRQLCDNFFSAIDLSFVKVLHTFLPIVEKREADTWMIIDRIRREFPGVQLSVPRVENDLLVSFNFEGLHQLAKNAWGIQEPKQGTLTNAEKIDVVLVPLLAFDRQGHRVGYGKGYYDKFLITCSPKVKKIGLSLFQPEDHIEAIVHDVRLDVCVTPQKTWNF